ncbi:hypothetical protein Nepgr_009763 [Nepenthes gracilis]|uniref:Uncharacterized protein n=1 Tax=Nepenthes gracilis TaxID=150966 RepID=A0AAD3SB39_NEPGR|nr:hypothetical protein Nepgr_009763 [Nepenthes gracilis]
MTERERDRCGSPASLSNEQQRKSSLMPDEGGCFAFYVTNGLVLFSLADADLNVNDEIVRRRHLPKHVKHGSDDKDNQPKAVRRAAGIVAECSSLRNAKAGAENAAQLSVVLVENTIVILMLVEDHLRL